MACARPSTPAARLIQSEPDSTTYIPAEAMAWIDEQGSLLIELHQPVAFVRQLSHA